MANLPIAIITDNVGTLGAGGNFAYYVTSSKIVGPEGPSAEANALGGLFSGSNNVFADGQGVHRKFDVTGDSHYTTAINPADDPVVGFVPCETIKSLQYKGVYNMHHQPYLTEGAPTVFANGKQVGYLGATYVCTATVEGRALGTPPASVFVPNTL